MVVVIKEGCSKFKFNLVKDQGSNNVHIELSVFGLPGDEEFHAGRWYDTKMRKALAKKLRQLAKVIGGRIQ